MSSGTDVIVLPLGWFLALGTVGFASIIAGIGAVFLRLRRLETAGAVDKAVKSTVDDQMRSTLSDLRAAVGDLRAEYRAAIAEIRGEHRAAVAELHRRIDQNHESPG